MTGFNIIKIFEKYQISPNEVAKILFPKAKHPTMALTRILEKKAHLDVIQVEHLAKYIGVPVGDLFYIEDWQCKTNDNLLTFVKDNFKVVLNRGGYFLTVFKDNEVVEQIIANNEALTIKQFIDFINNLTLNYKNGNFSKSTD